MAPGALERWKRTWWVFLPLVPFGWLAFVPFLVAGKKAGRRTWLVWAGIYFATAWGATWASWATDVPNRSVGYLVLASMIAGFVHALTIRRRYLTATGAAAGLRPRVRGDVVFGIFCGLFVVLFSVSWLPKDATVAAAFAMFGGAIACAGAVGVRPLPGGTPVLRRAAGGGSALVFRYRAGPTRLAAAILPLMLGAVTAFMAADERTASWMWAGLSVFLALSAVPVYVMSRVVAAGGSISLTDRGIAARTTYANTFVPWDVVTAIGHVELGGKTAIGLQLSDPAAVEMPRLDRIHLMLEWRDLPDVVYPAVMLEVDPELVAATLVHYWRHPDDRSELGRPESLERVEQLAAAQADATREGS